MSLKETIAKINKEAEAIQFTPADEAVRLFSHQIVPSQMGTEGQAFTTMVFAEGDCRALAYYLVLALTRLVDDPHFNVEQMKILFKEFVPMSAEFLGTCGMEKLWALTKEARSCVETVTDKKEFKELIDALAFYVSNLHEWVQHYFPWYIGELFPQRRKEEVKQMASMMGLLK